MFETNVEDLAWREPPLSKTATYSRF